VLLEEVVRRATEKGWLAIRLEARKDVELRLELAAAAERIIDDLGERTPRLELVHRTGGLPGHRCPGRERAVPHATVTVGSLTGRNSASRVKRARRARSRELAGQPQPHEIFRDGPVPSAPARSSYEDKACSTAAAEHRDER
jgi:hypothetical protein